MNKFVELLEQHCQWIGIGIGGLFLVWILYASVLVNPAAVVTPSGEEISPGEIDRQVKQEIADPLQRQIDDTRPVQTPPNAGGIIRKPWDLEFAGLDRATPTLPLYAFNSQPGEFKDRGGPIEAPKTDQITALPEPAPAPTMLDVKSARANVAPPPPPPGAPGAAQPVSGKDITYVRGHYSIDLMKMAQAFRDARIPQQATTSIIAVEVMRQVQKPDGTWDKPERVRMIDNGVRIMPVPPNNANRNQVAQFRAWAEGAQGQIDLVRPGFYTVAAGEGPWDPPAKLNILDPEKERLRRNEQLQREAIERRKNATPPRQPPPDAEPPPGRRRGSRNPEGMPMVTDPSRPNSYAELAGLELAQVPPPRVGPGEMFDPRDMDPNAVPVDPNAPGAPGAVVPAGGLPAPMFNPTLPGMPDKIVGWFFDEDVQEGRKYRYNVRYAIRNPAYESNLVDKPALAQQFVIWSDLDENGWSEAVEITPSTHFFLAQGNWAGNNVPQAVSVEVFKWAGGKWQRDAFRLAPGDRVGSDNSVAKFRTDNILVDIRYDERLDKAYVLFLGPDGRLIEQNPITARNDPVRQALMAEVNAGAPAPGPVGGMLPPVPLAGR